MRTCIATTIVVLCASTPSAWGNRVKAAKAKTLNPHLARMTSGVARSLKENSFLSSFPIGFGAVIGTGIVAKYFKAPEVVTFVGALASAYGGFFGTEPAMEALSRRLSNSDYGRLGAELEKAE